MIYKGHVPMDGINYHKEPILRMIRDREQLVKTIDLLD
jgi:hypothetical protein